MSTILPDFGIRVAVWVASMKANDVQVATMVPSAPIPQIRVAALKPFIAHLQRSGGRPDDLLRRAGLPEFLFDEEERLMPARQAIAFIEEAAVLREAGHLGLHAGVATRMDALGMFGRLIWASETLGDALDALVRFAPAFDSSSVWWTVQQGNRTWLCHAFRLPMCSSYLHVDHYWLGIALRLLGAAAEHGWRPDAIRLQTSATTGFAQQSVIAGAPVAFSQSETAIVFPSSLLCRRLPHGPSVPHVDRADVDRWTAAAPAAEFLGSIEQVIATLSSSAYARIDQVARAVGTGVRTLQRRLAEAGTCYERLLSRSRLDTATHLLARTDASVLDIALDLGYSDHAHFTRAFRRWMGVPPREFRRNAYANEVEPVAILRRS